MLNRTSIFIKTTISYILTKQTVIDASAAGPMQLTSHLTKIPNQVSLPASSRLVMRLAVCILNIVGAILGMILGMACGPDPLYLNLP
jgi:hypothetical protein